MAARRVFGLPFVVFRPHNVYGERQNCADRYRNVVGIFMNQAMTGEPMTVFGSGLQRRAFSQCARCRAGHRDGAARRTRVWRGVQHRSRRLMHGPGAGASHRRCRRCSAADRAPSARETAIAFANHEKARRVFGTRAKVTMSEGVARMAAWARTVGPSCRAPLRELEVAVNVPPSWRSVET